MFAYLNNADGSMRWLYPQGQKTPYFLALYNSSGWRSGLIRLLFRAAYALGLGARVKHGQIGVATSSPPAWLAVAEAQSHQLALFMGTKGENRKAVAAWGDAAQVKGFAKIPLTAASVQLVQNEARCLEQLAFTPNPQLQAPSARLQGETLLMSNVKTPGSRSYSVLKDIHLHALSNGYATGATAVMLNALPAWQQLNIALTQDIPQQRHPDLPDMRLQKILARLQDIYAHLSGLCPWLWLMAISRPGICL
jgi:hypothetical protein